LPSLPKAWAGVEVQPITSSLARDLGLPGPRYRITRRYPGSPLGNAGARVGDLLTGLEGEALRRSHETSGDSFHRRVRHRPVEHRARFQRLRDGRQQTGEATLAASPAEASALRTRSLSLLRAQLRELGFYDRVARRLPADQRGVLVDGVESGGPAGLAHLQGGDLIIRLGDYEVADLDGLGKALEAALAEGNGRVIPLQVIRGAETRILYLERYWLTETR